MKKQILDNADVTSSSKQIAILRHHFPSCFDKDGNFMPDKLAEIAQAEGADISREGYSLNWLGKSYARLMANLNTATLLAANTEHNSKDENKNSENILIQGDNLEVLKHLKNAYAEQVKMIYIDPPYNTGSDGFVYQDDRKFTVEELAGLAGIDEDEAKRILAFTRSKSNSHSAWLTFMYPRLYLARELLCEDGVIFMSIDDNEQSQLKLLCDEVFGAENFLGVACRATGQTTGQDGGGLGTSFDFVLAYGRSRGFDLSGLPLTAHDLKRFENEDVRGKYAYDQMLKTGANDRRVDRPNLYYSVTDPDGNEVLPIASAGYEGNWRFNEEAFHDLSERDYILWKRTTRFGKEVWWPYVKYYLEGRTKRPSPLWNDMDGNKKAARDLREIFDGKKVFSFPKPLALVQRCARIAPNSGKHDLILDFFSGSGTTAHAVMALNAEDNGKRQHITIQIDEPTDAKSEAHKAGYRTVYEITRERIVRAAKKIREDNPKAKCDFGFKEFMTVPVFDGYLNEADTPDQYTIFDGDALSDEHRAQLLLTWQVFDQLPITIDLTEVALDGYTAYLGRHILYFTNSGLTLDHILKMLSRIDEEDDFTPTKIVIFESVLSSKAKREITEAVKGYNNRKQIELHFEIRL